MLILFFIGSSSLFSQEHEKITNEHKKLKNELVGFAGATYILKSGYFLPTFGVEYETN
jgi:hypothetical protein